MADHLIVLIISHFKYKSHCTLNCSIMFKFNSHVLYSGAHGSALWFYILCLWGGSLHTVYSAPFQICLGVVAFWQYFSTDSGPFPLWAWLVLIGPLAICARDVMLPLSPHLPLCKPAVPSHQLTLCLIHFLLKPELCNAAYTRGDDILMLSIT